MVFRKLLGFGFGMRYLRERLVASLVLACGLRDVSCLLVRLLGRDFVVFFGLCSF